MAANNRHVPEPAQSEDRLVALAVLKATWDESRQSYVEGFLPFVMEGAYHDGREAVPIADIRHQLDESFGFTVPDAVVRRVLDTAYREGLGRLDRHEFVFTRADLARFDTSTERQRLRREQRAVVQALVGFARENFSIELTDETAERALVEHLAAAGTDVLLDAVGRPDPYDTRSRARAEYVVGSFIEWLLATEPDLSEYVERLVVGSMIGTAIHTGNVDAPERRFRDLTVYLDTPVVIDLLGRAGDVPASAAKESVRLLNQAGARVACFEHTVAEVRSVFHGLADAMTAGFRRGRPPAFGSVEEYVVTNRLSASDVLQFAVGVDQNLGRLGVRVEEAPPYTAQLQRLDETQALERLIEHVHHERPNAERAARYDLDSLTAVYRKRGQAPRHELEAAGSVFVTTNRALVRTAHGLFRGVDVPVAMLLSDIVTMAWLKLPREAPDLPRLRIAADAYAASNPSNELIGRLTDVLVSLKARGAVSDADLYELRYGTEAHVVLLRKVHVDEREVDEPTVLEVLEETRDVLRATAEAGARVEAEALRLQLQNEEEARRRAEEQAVLARDELSRHRSETDVALQTATRHNRLLRLATAALLLVVVGVFLARAWPHAHTAKREAVVILAAILGAGAVISLVAGKTRAAWAFGAVGFLLGAFDALVGILSK